MFRFRAKKLAGGLRQVDVRRELVLTVLMSQRGNAENDACYSTARYHDNKNVSKNAYM